MRDVLMPLLFPLCRLPRRHHRLRGADRIERGLVVEIFLTVPQIGGLPPGGAALREGDADKLETVIREDIMQGMSNIVRGYSVDE